MLQYRFPASQWDRSAFNKIASTITEHVILHEFSTLPHCGLRSVFAVLRRIQDAARKFSLLNCVKKRRLIKAGSRWSQYTLVFPSKFFPHASTFNGKTPLCYHTESTCRGLPCPTGRCNIGRHLLFPKEPPTCAPNLDGENCAKVLARPAKRQIRKSGRLCHPFTASLYDTW